MGHQNPKKSIYSERLDKTESPKKNSTAQHLRVKFEVHIFQKINSDLGQLGPWAHKSAQNMNENLAKLSKTCLTLRGCYSLNIYQKCSKKPPQVSEIHIFQKIKSDLGQFTGPWAKLAQI